MTAPDDSTLLRCFAARQAESEEAFRALYDRYAGMIYGVCRRSLSPADAEDAAQAVFLVLVKKAPQLDDIASLGGWLYRAAQLAIADVRRNAARRRDRENQARESRSDIAETVEPNADEVQRGLDEAIASLRKKQQDAVVLHYLQGKTVRETAAAMGCSEETAKKRVSHALEKLRSLLARRRIAMPAAAIATALSSSARAAAPSGFIELCRHSFAQSLIPGATARPDLIAKGVMKTMWMLKLKAAAAVVVSALAIGGATTMVVTAAEKPPAAGEAAKEPVREGPFAKLPDADPAHLAKLAALGDDSWIDLGSGVADPKWGCGTGRSWSPKMAYASDLHGGFLFGLANHGAHNEKTRRFSDDLWFYHAPSNHWICVWPGTPVDDPQLRYNKDGIETVRGEVAPIATLIHGYCALDYDPDTHCFVHIPQNEKNYKGILEGPIAEMRAKAEVVASAPSPWYFNTITGKWLRKNSSTPGMAPAPPATLMFYLPTKKVVWEHDFAFGSNLSGIYDFAKNQWTCFGAGKFNDPVTDTDDIACYDSKRHCINLLRWSGHWVFDVDTMTWRNAQPSGFCGAIGYVSTFSYDSVNDVCVLIMYRGNEKNGVWIYDPNKNAWSKTANPIPGWTENGNGFYDPELNVHFFYNARDNDPGKMWAYRYKKAAKAK